MARVHFVKVDLPLDRTESAELNEQLEKALKASGRPNDKVIILSFSSWLGSVEIDEPF
jgi:hypothetical protein